MKTKILLLLTSLFLGLKLASSHALSTSVEDDHLGKILTAKEYCTFLNSISVHHAENLYDEKMATAIGDACILRAGSCGEEVFQVIPGKEDVAVTFVSWNNIAAYVCWQTNHSCSFIHDISNSCPREMLLDPFLKSNHLTFELLNTEATIHQAGEPEEATIRSLLDEMIETVIALSLGGSTTSYPERTREPIPEQRTAPTEKDVSNDEPSLLGSSASHRTILNHLRQTIATYPTAARLIITKEGDLTSLRPQEDLPNAAGKNRSENKKTIDALKAFIPPGVADLLLHYRTTTMGVHVSPLTSQRLQAILDCYEAQRNREARMPKPLSPQVAPTSTAALEKERAKLIFDRIATYAATKPLIKMRAAAKVKANSMLIESNRLTQLGEQELAALLKKQAEEYDVAAFYYAEAIEAFPKKNKQDAEYLIRAARATWNDADTSNNSVHQLEKAILAFKSQRAAALAHPNQPRLIKLYKQQVSLHEAAAAYYAQAAKAYAQHKTQEAKQFHHAATMIDDGIHGDDGAIAQIKKAIEVLEKAFACINARQLELAELYTQQAEKHLITANFYTQTAELYAQHKIQKASSYQRTAEFYRDASTGSDLSQKITVLEDSYKKDLRQQTAKDFNTTQGVKAYSYDDVEAASLRKGKFKIPPVEIPIPRVNSVFSSSPTYFKTSPSTSLRPSPPASFRASSPAASTRTSPSTSFRVSTSHNLQASPQNSFRMSPHSGSQRSSRDSSRSRANSVLSEEAIPFCQEWPPRDTSPHFSLPPRYEPLPISAKEPHLDFTSTNLFSRSAQTEQTILATLEEQKNDALLLWTHAEEAEKGALARKAHILTLPHTERGVLWNTVIQEAENITKAWAKAARSRWFSAPQYATARNQEKVWLAKKALYQAELAESTTYMAEWFKVKKAENAANKKRKKREILEDAKKITLLDEVIFKAYEAAEAWNHTASFYQKSHQEASRYFKDSWQQSLAEVKQRALTWIDKLTFYQAEREKIAPSPFVFSLENLKALHAITTSEPLRASSPAPKDQLSAEEANDFEGASLEATEEIDLAPFLKQKTYVRLLKTNLQFPYLRVEELIDSSNRVVSRSEMAADHLFVTVAAGEEENFMSQFQELNLQQVWLEKISEDRYLLYFAPVSLENWNKVWEKVQTILGANPKPDYLSQESGSGNTMHQEKISPGLTSLKALQWNLYGPRGIQAEAAWKLLQNKAVPTIQKKVSEVTAAVLDSGIDFEHLALKNSKDSFHHDFIKGTEGVTDEHGHGTHCAGIIGAMEEERGIFGVAKEINLMGVRWLDKRLHGFDSTLVKALSYARTNEADILNCSIRQASQLPDSDIENQLALAKGEKIIVVVPAGNRPKDHKEALNLNKKNFYPASYRLQFDNMVVVAATQKDSDHLADFSNRGANVVDIAAPGKEIFSTWPVQGSKEGIPLAPNNVYFVESGTSMAVPHVVGALAHLKTKYPTLSYAELIQHLYDTADYVEELDGLVCEGRRLNLFDALNTVPSQLETTSEPVTTREEATSETDEESENIEHNEQSERDTFSNTTAHDARKITKTS